MSAAPAAADPFVVCLGDLVVDVTCRLGGPIERDTDTAARVSLDAGGQAANVAAWVVAAGGRSRLIAARSTDSLGVLAAGALRSRGVELIGPEVAAPGGAVVLLVHPGGGRDMLSDRGAAAALRPEDVRAGDLDGASALFVSGYALAGPQTAAAAIRAAGLARARGAIVAVDVASVALHTATGADRFRAAMAALQPGVVLATTAEIEALGGREVVAGPTAALVEKRGPDGASLYRPGEAERHVPAPPAVVADTTGAGDALSGALLAGLVRGLAVDEALSVAVELAAVCVARVGALPPPVDADA